MAFCAAKGITESAAVETAIEAYLAGDERDNEVILRRLDRLTRAAGRHQRDLEIQSEAFAVIAQTFFALIPDLPPAEKASRQQLGRARYQHFLDTVADRIGRGDRLANDVIPKPSTDDSPTRPREIHGATGAKRT